MLILIKKDVDEECGGDWNKCLEEEFTIEEEEEFLDEYKNLVADFTTLGLKFEVLAENKEFAIKMDKIRLEINDQDATDLINFTLDELAKTGEEIAKDPDALEAFNEFAKLASKEYGR